MPSIQAAWQWAIDKCNDPNVGYSQTYRNQQTVDGITYYDCSSFIWYALVAGGFAVSGYPFTTSDMMTTLLQLGFTFVDINGLWVAGDIVWRDGHCEMVYSGSTGYGITMGAHSANVPLADQVSINSNPSYASSYTYLLRYTGGGGGTSRVWVRDPTHHGNLTDAEMQNNALCMRDWFIYNTDWSLQALAGMAANMQGESRICPDAMENPSLPIGTVNKDGLGLVQWTTSPGMSTNPLFDILDYLYSSHSDWETPEKQCRSIVAEYEYCTGLIHTTVFEAYWRTNSQYPLTFQQWAHSTQNPGYLAMHFEFSYERPTDTHPEREGWGNTWYQYFLNNPYVPPSPVPGRRKKMPIWMMIRYRY